MSETLSSAYEKPTSLVLNTSMNGASLEIIVCSLYITKADLKKESLITIWMANSDLSHVFF